MFNINIKLLKNLFTAFDITFNSEFGLRGAYFRSPDDGEEFDRNLIATLSPKLFDWSKSQQSNFDADVAVRSLEAPSAKVWLAEKTLHLCERCEGEWSSDLASDLTISNGRWELVSKTHANWGRMAHYFSKLRILGAFVNDTNEEYVAEHKRNRSQHILEHGWT